MTHKDGLVVNVINGNNWIIINIKHYVRNVINENNFLRINQVRRRLVVAKIV